MLLMTAIGFSVKTQVGIALAAITYLLPMVGATVLTGKLAGIFASRDKASVPNPSDSQPDPSVEDTPHLSSAVQSSPQESPFQPPATATAVQPLASSIKRLSAVGDNEITLAIAEAEALRAQAPGHAGLLAELAKLYQRSGRTAEATTTASEAISRALSTGATVLAVNCYDAFATQRKSMVLSAPELEQLGRALLVAQKFSDAAWSFSTLAKSGGEPLRVQKGMIAAGEAATKAGQLAIAARVYEYVINYAPGSTNAEYCQEALERVQARLKRLPS
jgi:hypothetical protein